MGKIIFTSVISVLVSTAIIAFGGSIAKVNFLTLFGMPIVDSGIITITDNGDKRVQFNRPFSKPPAVTLGSVYSSHNMGEAVATMANDPTIDGFSVRLIRIKNRSFANGKVNWVAIGK